MRLRLEPLIDQFQASQIRANDGLWIDSAVNFVPHAARRHGDGADGGPRAALKAEALFQWMRQSPEPGQALAVNLARLLAARAAA